MNNLVDIQSQIKKLQKQEAAIKDKEFDATVREIRTKMAAFGITLKDLQSPKARTRHVIQARDKSSSAGKSVNSAGEKIAKGVAAKYRGPNGELWSGRGLMPRWMAALTAQGQKKEEFAIAGKPAAEQTN